MTEESEASKIGARTRSGRRDVIVSTAIICLLIIVSYIANNVQSRQAVDRANRSWCPALVALTKTPVPKPVDPAANPSRENNYKFYLIFLNQRERFGCNG